MKILSLIVLLLAANAAFAQSGAGRFLSVVGDVRVTGADGRTRAAERGADLREGETIVTGANALAQLRMADGAQMSVRPDTEMKLERFAYAGAEDREPTFLASIVKGGLRVITGLMARQNRAGYAIRTASATMGVRGTHFELVHVPQAQPELLAGTYNRVYDGVTVIENRAGTTLLVNRDQTAFISLPGTLAPQIVLPPPAIFSRPTPVPGVVLRQPTDMHKGEVARPAVRDTTTIVAPRPIQTVPIETRTITTTPILTSPTTTTISPTISPTLDTSTTTIRLDTSTTLTAPTTTTTTTIKLDPVLTAPTTTTTTTTTTTNILTSPTTTTIQTSPILQSPTTTTILK